MGLRRTGEDAGTDISIRIAAYPLEGPPELTEVSAGSGAAAASKFSRLVQEKVREFGGRVPEEAVREVIENLIHAEYRGVVISILDGGNIVRVSDKGPGIASKEHAFDFGFSGATPEALESIRGVGAGLGIARSAAEKVGGKVEIEDNIGGGTVVTISTYHAENEGEASAEEKPRREEYPNSVPRMDISERQQKVLLTVLECAEVGPSTVAQQLEISVSTAYRDLSALEGYGLLATTDSGKRAVSMLGRDYAQAIISNWV